MPLMMIRQDIVKMNTDVIVSAVKPDFSETGGAEGALLQAGGILLRHVVRRIRSCPVGEARITKGYRLAAKYVIHTAGPVWEGGGNDEAAALASCYRSALSLAQKHRCTSIAFPLIAAGARGFPPDRAMRIAADTIRDFLETCDMMVYLVFYDTESYRIGTQLYGEIAQYIVDRSNSRDHRYRQSALSAESPLWQTASIPVPEMPDFCDAANPFTDSPDEDTAASALAKPTAPAAAAFAKPSAAPAAGAVKSPGIFAGRKTREKHSSKAAYKTASPEDMTRELTQILQQTDESFSQMLLRKIDESGMTDAECYKKANIDRKLFSKIRSDVLYRPSKMTVLAFAVALEMDLEETEDFLKRAGFAFSPSSKADLILEYFIEREIYDIFLINEALFTFDQRLLGG